MRQATVLAGAKGLASGEGVFHPLKEVEDRGERSSACGPLISLRSTPEGQRRPSICPAVPTLQL